jgi:hypothetical protein
MHFIHTPDALVEQLRKKAKKLQRAGGGKHVDLLDRVARSSGYLHWHHVIQCNARTVAAQDGMPQLVDSCNRAVAACEAGDLFVEVLRGPGVPPVVLFAAESDAWVLNPLSDDARCLVWRGQRIALAFRESTEGVAPTWDARYKLMPDLFAVKSTREEIGAKGIIGFPLEQIGAALRQANGR